MKAPHRSCQNQNQSARLEAEAHRKAVRRCEEGRQVAAIPLISGLNDSPSLPPFGQDLSEIRYTVSADHLWRGDARSGGREVVTGTFWASRAARFVRWMAQSRVIGPSTAPWSPHELELGSAIAS